MGKKNRRQRASAPSSNANAAERSGRQEETTPSNLNLPEQVPSMSQFAGDFQEHMQQLLTAMQNGSIIDRMKPMEITRDVEKKIKSLPRSDQTWFIDADKNEMTEDPQGSPRLGYMALIHANLALVTKESGSNGKPWVPSQAQNLQAECDGLSFCLASCAYEYRDTYTITPLQESKVCHGTIAKACLEPGMSAAVSMIGGASFDPVRPSKVLFSKQGIMNLLREPLLDMGIKEVGIASRKLIQSMRASFPEKSETDNQQMAAMAAAIAEPDNAEHLARLLMTKTESCYVPETRQSLGSWRPEPDMLECYPLSWWYRPPADGEGYRHTMLFGWRTNLELACERGDKKKIRQLVQEYSATDARDYAERRLLLTKAATKGLISSCKLLIEVVGAAVDGVRSPDNKPEWRKSQEGSGNNNDNVGMTPLACACKEGNTAVVKYLISKGAKINIASQGFTRAYPLHFAVLGGHLDCVKVLFRNGADVNERDFSGSSPSMLASACLSGTVGGNQHSDAHQKIIAFLKNPDTNVNACSACGNFGGRQCPCGLEIYCDQACQRARWKYHKKAHRDLMGEL